MVDVLPLVHNRTQLVANNLQVLGGEMRRVGEGNSDIVAMNDS